MTKLSIVIFFSHFLFVLRKVKIINNLGKLTFSGIHSSCQDFPSNFLSILKRVFFCGPY